MTTLPDAWALLCLMACWPPTRFVMIPGPRACFDSVPEPHESSLYWESTSRESHPVVGALPIGAWTGQSDGLTWAVHSERS